jgi:hypothetical protein
MAAMATVVKLQTRTGGNSTYVIDTVHTASKPALILQKIKAFLTGQHSVLEDTVNVVYATEDSNGDLLPSNISFSTTIRRPIDGISADLTAALATFRDVTGSDEFTAIVNERVPLGN